MTLLPCLASSQKVNQFLCRNGNDQIDQIAGHRVFADIPIHIFRNTIYGIPNHLAVPFKQSDMETWNPVG